MYTCRHVQKKLYVVWFCVATPEQFSVALAWLTPFCLTLPQLFLPAGLRQGNCRKLTTWIGKAITCRAHSVVRFRKTNKKLDSDFSDANFEFDGWIFFDWSCGLVWAPLLGPYRCETPHVEPFSHLYLVPLLKKHS